MKTTRILIYLAFSTVSVAANAAVYACIFGGGVAAVEVNTNTLTASLIDIEGVWSDEAKSTADVPGITLGGEEGSTVVVDIPEVTGGKSELVKSLGGTRLVIDLLNKGDDIFGQDAFDFSATITDGDGTFPGACQLASAQ